MREGDWKLSVAGETPQLYNLREDIGEAQNVMNMHPELVARLKTLMDGMKDDLGINGIGPGCRPLGHVENPQPLIPYDEMPPTATVALDKLKIGDTLPSSAAPQISGKPLTVSCDVETTAKDAVIVAHGGIGVGYALILKGGRVAWVVRSGRASVTTVTAPQPIEGKLHIEARLTADKTMTLSLNGAPVASGQAPSLILSQPQEDFCVGFDNKMPVGDYDGSKHLPGTISNLQVSAGKNKEHQ